MADFIGAALAASGDATGEFKTVKESSDKSFQNFGDAPASPVEHGLDVDDLGSFFRNPLNEIIVEEYDSNEIENVSEFSITPARNQPNRFK